MDEVFGQSKSFFELPLNEKMKVLRNEKHRGYTPVLDELLDPDNQVHALNGINGNKYHHLINSASLSTESRDKVVGDYKEGYYIGVEVPEDDPEAEKPFYGPNVWPEDGLLPGWRQTMEKFHHQALEVAKAVARIIALALGLEVDFFDKPEMLGKPIATLRLLHYGGQVSDPSKGLYGAGAHSDYGLITLLATDDVMGLQICKDKDAKPQIWEYVAPSFYSQSWGHARTVEQLYIQIAYFVEPSHDCLVECLPTCKSENNPPKFPPIYCATYLSQRYKDTHAELSVYEKHQT
ncbi:hypothetical protein Gorai_003565 [Gossypium raimondii]|uniref:Fe2OG dioxygenase domain-containing protein n=1 Tax=Gossypium raimondii TaxID=29730 RepID=A0A7J8QPM4_GOSRA|nr:hypothetical protein [Gossypium raimondii]